MNWQTFLDTLLLALAGAIPLVAYWFKLWITARIAELKAASAINSSRLDQHAEAITDIQQHPALSIPELNGPSVSLMTRSEPVTLSSDALHETPDTGTMTEVTDALKANRPRVGQVVDPHDTANAILSAQAGIKP